MNLSPSANFQGSKWFCFGLFVVLLAFRSGAQSEDSTDIRLFGYEDLNLDMGKKKRAITSTNRLTESPEDMAQEVIIIDGDEIRKFGYATLVDVLKGIPGFRTSQPGNAIEGETFLMRGLYGNDMAKILINGVPIKPEAVRGMPIASQLPIRHAERIEIVLGPSSSSYGTDAMAGVINIVLPEVDRPVFAWADVNLMTPKTTEMNLTLGGKVGKGKSILNYELFASSSRSSDINILALEDSVKVQPGEFDSLTSHPNLDAYRWELFFGEDSIPELDYLKRESRLLGTYIKFRWFEFNAMNMYRQEHSGIGSNPLIQSYHAPDLYFGENINSFSLKYNDVNEKRYMSKFLVSALTYRTLTNSSYYGINHPLSNGNNHMYARSADFNAEYSGVLKINSQMRLGLGTTADYSISHPFTNYLLRPYRDESFTFDLRPEQQNLETGGIQSAIVDSISDIAPGEPLMRYTRYNYGGFLQFSYKSRDNKFFLELGTRVDHNSFQETVFTPKAGIVYRPWPRLKLRAYYGTGYRAPRSYYLYNNYKQNYKLYDSIGPAFERRKEDLYSERLQGGEIGVDWKATDYLKITGKYYVHFMKNKMIREIFLPPPPNDQNAPKVNDGELIGFGFSNDQAYSFLQSVLVNVEFVKKIGQVELDFLASYQYSRGLEYVQTEDTSYNEERETSEYRYVPRHLVKANFDFRFYDFTLSFRNSIIGPYVTDIYLRNRRQVVHSESDRYFYNLDILLHKQLFRQLSIFGGVYNVLNSIQSGIPNVSLTSTWAYNPQMGRIFRFGLTFQLN